MNTPSVSTQPIQHSSTYNYIKETILSNRQILMGLAFIGSGILLQRGELAPGGNHSIKRMIGALGLAPECVGVGLIGTSKEQTYQKALALTITGIFLMIMGDLSQKNQSPFVAGYCLTVSGISGLLIPIIRNEPERQNSLSQTSSELDALL